MRQTETGHALYDPSNPASTPKQMKGKKLREYTGLPCCWHLSWFDMPRDMQLTHGTSRGVLFDMPRDMHSATGPVCQLHMSRATCIHQRSKRLLLEGGLAKRAPFLSIV